jgi:hypothetical protein
MRRLLVWIGAGTLVVLTARSLAYATEPTPAARLFEQRAGGPSLPVLALVSLSLGASLAVAICWLVALGVRERALLERRVGPRFSNARTIVSALALALATSVAGGLFEAYVHWRSGLGWHGFDCLFGPVHRDLLPLEGALSVVAAATIAAAEHVLAWMRRTLVALRSLPPRPASRKRLRAAVSFDLPRDARQLAGAGPRAPPVFS